MVIDRGRTKSQGQIFIFFPNNNLKNLLITERWVRSLVFNSVFQEKGRGNVSHERMGLLVEGVPYLRKIQSKNKSVCENAVTGI